MVNARKVVVLVILYSIANITSYYALARVDASVYTVMLQVIQCAPLAVDFGLFYENNHFHYIFCTC